MSVGLLTLLMFGLLLLAIALGAPIAFALGGVYAIIVRKTGSLYGVTLSHGLVNVILFLIGPVFL